jgi:hypothetical protein
MKHPLSIDSTWRSTMASSSCSSARRAVEVDDVRMLAGLEPIDDAGSC